MMKKILTLLATLLISANALADWEYLAESSNKKFVVYVDKSTIKQSSNRRVGLLLLDFKDQQNTGSPQPYFSYTEKISINCQEDEQLVLMQVSYQNHMGQGASFNNDVATLLPTRIPPHSIYAVAEQIFCKKPGLRK